MESQAPTERIQPWITEEAARLLRHACVDQGKSQGEIIDQLIRTAYGKKGGK